MTVRMVFGVSDWPEEYGKEFEICEVRPGETDDQAIARARKSYSPDLECVIREVSEHGSC